eukprot:GHVS01081561.1.p1 GENE.GHVS01081561.1~~GHVS01081561.1.p1  ORF type:complete len:286 (-),score=52.49 GHVS01081561.1:218-1075(-)
MRHTINTYFVQIHSFVNKLNIMISKLLQRMLLQTTRTTHLLTVNNKINYFSSRYCYSCLLLPTTTTTTQNTTTTTRATTIQRISQQQAHTNTTTSCCRYCRRNFTTTSSVVPNVNRFTGPFGEGVFVSEHAVLIGKVSLGPNASVWTTACVRADVNSISIGERSNVQDGAVIHCSGGWGDSSGFPTTIGRNVSIGHQALLHGCHIHDNVLIGMACVVMDGAEIDSDVLLGAGSLVSPGKKLCSGLWVGRPATRVRDLTDKDKAYIRENAENYVFLKNKYLEAKMK